MRNVKKVIRKIFPFVRRKHYKILIDTWRETRWIYRHSRTYAPFDHREKMVGLIRLNIHALEKGLALPEPRSFFGREIVQRLIQVLSVYEKKFGIDKDVTNGYSILREYLDSHSTQSQDPLAKEITRFLQGKNFQKNMEVGVGSLTRELFIKSTRAVNFADFISTRHSVRDFTGQKVPDDLICQAVDIARNTPSACNRQPWKIYLIGEENRRKILDLQGGSKGFLDAISNLALITSTINYYGRDEKSAHIIDGSMFAMTFMYALHSLGLATCPLNASLPGKSEQAVRALLGISPPESLIVFLAIGYMKSRCKIAKSERIGNQSIIRRR